MWWWVLLCFVLTATAATDSAMPAGLATWSWMGATTVASRTTCLSNASSCPSGSSLVGSTDFCCKDVGSYNRVDNKQCVSDSMEGFGIALIVLFLLSACLCCPCYVVYFVLVFVAGLLFPLDLILVPLVLLICCPCTLGVVLFLAGVLLMIFHRVDPEAQYNC